MENIASSVGSIAQYRFSLSKGRAVNIFASEQLWLRKQKKARENLF
jgi:hypothetical protein